MIIEKSETITILKADQEMIIEDLERKILSSLEADQKTRMLIVKREMSHGRSPGP